MATLVGIDEAGFGPILGPLVISSCAFSMPRSKLDADLWQVLKKSVGKTKRRLLGRLLIADSKKAYNRSAGLRHLERTILTCLKYLGNRPATLTELISLLCPDCLERLSAYPWYQNAAEYPLPPEPADLKIASSVFAADLAANNIELLRMRSCCLDVATYNTMVNAVNNKANVLFTAICRLIKETFDNFADDDLQILIDRQGGRTRYRRNLQRMFPDMQLTIITETPKLSSYELDTAGRKMRLHFAVGADDRFLPVSLASMTSKYLRELMIANINRHFTSLVPDLKPTAGYWKDGLRFIADLKAHHPDVTYDPNQFIRCR